MIYPKYNPEGMNRISILKKTVEQLMIYTFLFISQPMDGEEAEKCTDVWPEAYDRPACGLLAATDSQMWSD